MAPVQLYAYDLSRGMAAQMSRQLTGTYIEGIWHSSIVFHGKEFWYGQGIQYNAPGQSHLGSPLKIHQLGDSEIDEETFIEYINEMRSVYTADKYHLLDFNCNSFTNDCAGFLTGGSVPDYIKDLPRDFLNTPFGAALRPTIDQMFRRPAQTVPATQPLNDRDLASGILQGVTASATASSPLSAFANGTSSPSATLTAPVQICTNPASFNTILERHKATVAFFTSQTCGPCRMIEPTFESLAKAKASPKVAFVKVDMGVGMGHQVAQVHNIHATPTFLFFLNGKKTHEVRGANAPELRSQIDLLIYDAFPPHPHSKLALKSLRDVSLNPILFTQVPKLDVVSAKLTSSIESCQASQGERTSMKQTILQQMIPTIQSRLGPNKTPGRVTSDQVKTWAQSTELLLKQAPSPQLFPLVDLWRLAVLIPEVPTILGSDGVHVITSMLTSATDSISSPEGKNLAITGIRLACNLFSNAALSRQILTTSPLKDKTVPRNVIMGLLVQALLAETQSIRVAAASIAFNVSALWQTPLMECLHKGMTGQMTYDEVLNDADWQVEMVSAVVEAIGREDNEDSLHRLVTCLGFMVHLSPHLEDIRPLLEVLQTKETLRSKLQVEQLVQKKSVRDLLEEVGEQLC